MDTSEKYIEMCRAATEIQMIWKPYVGDYFWYLPKTLDSTSFLCDHSLLIDRIGVWLTPRTGLKGLYEIWLPRQDQLQDLLGDNLLDIAKGFYDYMTTTEYMTEVAMACDDPEIDCNQNVFNSERTKEFASMEQLWLAYVMSDKYGKQWDGTKWFDPDAPKEPPKTLFSQILEAHTRVKADNYKPNELRMSTDAGIALSCELANTRIGIRLRLGMDVRVLDMKVIIDDTIPEGEFMIVGEAI